MQPGFFVSLTLSLIPLLVLQGCSSSSSRARAELQNGQCPPSIIDTGNASGNSSRYGSGASQQDISRYRDQELANCEHQVAQGDISALHVLVNYWYERNNPARIAQAYRSYLDKGNDNSVLAQASAYLYRVHSSGANGISADPAASLHYLGLAVDYGRTDLTLTYADALHENGRYQQAFDHYYRIATSNNGTNRYYSKEQLCEINFKLANLYFTGAGTRENWYLGYYFWARGSSMADGPQWGSCAEDNFVFGDRYALESERKKQADIRIKALSESELRMLRQNAKKPNGQGLEYLSALEFTPRSTGNIPRGSYVTPAPGPTGGLWQRWTPLSGEICQMRHSPRPLAWSDIFELRSSAIWALSSSTTSKSSRGSAVAVNPRQLITNCHLIQNPSNVTLQKSNRRLRAEVVAADVEGDRCVVQVAETLTSYVRNARQYAQVRVGEDVSAIGNPQGLDSSLSRGIIAQKRTKKGRAYLQTDTAISSGSSGGGLFDRAGNLVGITTFTVASGENLNFAIAVDEFCR